MGRHRLPLCLVALLLVAPAAAARRYVAAPAHHRRHQPGCKAQAVVQQEPRHRDPGKVAHVCQGSQVDAPATPPCAGEQFLRAGQRGKGRRGF